MEISEAHATLVEQISHVHSLGTRHLSAQSPSRTNKPCKAPEPKIPPKPSKTHRSNLPNQPVIHKGCSIIHGSDHIISFCSRRSKFSLRNAKRGQPDLLNDIGAQSEWSSPRLDHSAHVCQNLNSGDTAGWRQRNQICLWLCITKHAACHANEAGMQSMSGGCPQAYLKAFKFLLIGSIILVYFNLHILFFFTIIM